MPDRLRRADREFAGRRPDSRRNRLASLLRHPPKLLGVRHQREPGGGQRNATSGAIEQGRSQLGFQCFDLLRNCRLSQQQFLGGDAKVQVLCDRAKDSQTEVFHCLRLTLRYTRR